MLQLNDEPTRTSRSISYSFEFITSTLILFALWVADPQWCPSGSVNILIFIENKKSYCSVTEFFCLQTAVTKNISNPGA